MQQLPRDDKSIKMMLCAGPGKKYEEALAGKNTIKLDKAAKVFTNNNWVNALDLKPNNILTDEFNNKIKITNIYNNVLGVFISYEEIL